jgi:hypothetical protein
MFSALRLTVGSTADTHILTSIRMFHRPCVGRFPGLIGATLFGYAARPILFSFDSKSILSMAMPRTYLYYS